MPGSVMSDRGPQFNNLFWKEVNALTGMKRKLSSAYHPQTDGQTESTNRTLEEMLRAYVQPDQNDWDEHLACAEFAINNSWQEALISLWTKKGLQGGKTIQQRSGFAQLWSILLLPVPCSLTWFT